MSLLAREVQRELPVAFFLSREAGEKNILTHCDIAAR